MSFLSLLLRREGGREGEAKERGEEPLAEDPARGGEGGCFSLARSLLSLPLSSVALFGGEGNREKGEKKRERERIQGQEQKVSSSARGPRDPKTRDKKQKTGKRLEPHLAVPRHQRVGVHPEPLHVPVVERDAHVVHQEGKHVHRLGMVREEVGDAPALLFEVSVFFYDFGFFFLPSR